MVSVPPAGARGQGYQVWLGRGRVHAMPAQHLGHHAFPQVVNTSTIITQLSTLF